MSALFAMSHSDGAMERLLLREFVHRMNNEFASAISAIAAAERRCDSLDAKAAMASARKRLIGHANVQQFLRMPDYTTMIDLAAYLHQLCRAISESKLAGEGIGLSLALFPLKMRSDRCWLLGMIVFELITNAARHAFRNKANREIRLTVILADRSIACSITDNGECDGGRSPGRGIAIVEALAATLKGTVDMQFGRSGSIITVNVPVAE